MKSFSIEKQLMFLCFDIDLLLLDPKSKVFKLSILTQRPVRYFYMVS